VSDHLSSYRALCDPVVDLTDLYAFPTPGADGRLTLIMNTFPNARPGAAFSDAVAYRFRLRTATVHPGIAPHVTCDTREYGLTVTFSDLSDPSDSGPRQTATCTFGTGSVITATVGAVDSGDGGPRLFAGPRLDPFFMDVAAEVRTRRTRTLAFQPVGTNAVDGLNVLSIVVDCDVRTVFGDGLGPVIAVVAETATLGEPGCRFERTGRPEMKNVLLSVNGNDPRNRDVDLRDLYNLEDAFALSDTYLPAFRARLAANLALFNGLDPRRDSGFTGPDGHPLTSLLLDDFLLVDMAKPSRDDGFLDIERSALRGQPHLTCGGRTPNHDAIDTLYTLIVNGIDGPAVRDGVDQATVPANVAFPFLAPPNDDPPVPDPGVPITAAP
jgi:hypothetical protein